MKALTLAPPSLPASNQSRNWESSRFLTCSVLPVRMACNLSCKFCFSKSSISSLQGEGTGWTAPQLEAYYSYSRSKGASRLVITGGGEPLLRPASVLEAIRSGRRFFGEIALFTNGVYLNRKLAERLADAGLSYVCFSRHHFDDDRNRDLMGRGAIRLEEYFANVSGLLKTRATCVLCQGFIEDRPGIGEYMRVLGSYGVREFTFKHTYVAYENSLFQNSAEDQWAEQNQVNNDPFQNEGEMLATLPWGPQIKKIGDYQVCYYYEPTPAWEMKHQICRSINLLTDGNIYASLEDQQSLLSTLQP